MTISDILEFIEENDVKFIRLSFCTPFGTQKNISIMASEIESAFENGVSFDASAIEGFSDVAKSDLLLFPDINTLSLLPWRPNVNAVLRFYCDIKNPDKTNYESDSRQILKNAISELKQIGFNCKIGTECEFYLFKTDENEKPTFETLDEGGYFDVSPLDKGENIRREICLLLEEMGLEPERSHHEQGPGQNEVDFKFSDVLTSADNLMTFKSVVKSVAARNGLFASFMPKPIINKSGNGLHINLSVYKDNVNLFSDEKSENYKYAQYFMAGIMDKIKEITLFLNNNNNSYERFGEFEAPVYISWSAQNRSQLIRLPVVSEKAKRMELRSADCALNPYLAFALILRAGTHGIKNRLELMPALDENLFELSPSEKSTLSTLPLNLNEAIELAKGSEFVKQSLNEQFLDKYFAVKTAEFKSFDEAKDKHAYNIETYFDKL